MSLMTWIGMGKGARKEGCCEDVLTLLSYKPFWSFQDFIMLRPNLMLTICIAHSTFPPS